MFYRPSSRLNQNINSATAKAIEDDSKLQLVLLAGDMSYADGDQVRSS